MAQAGNVCPMFVVAMPMRAPRLAGFLFDFTSKQVQSCAFAFSLVGLLATTRIVSLPWMTRYDWMFVFCVAIQLLMVKLRFETWRDAAIVGVFHILGTALEVYKVAQGSWSYPEPATLVVAGVPLFAGFMYGSVASYMCLAWKKLNLRASGWPTPSTALIVAALIYFQFFAPIWRLEARLLMLAGVFAVFWRSRVHFDCAGARWQMPMPLAFALIGAMIYAAENIGTAVGAWRYPNQANGWEWVHPTKMLAWTLLMTVSLIVVAEYKRRLRLLAATGQAARSLASLIRPARAQG